MKKIAIIALISLVTSGYAGAESAESAEDKGLDIANEVEHRDQGWIDTSTSMKMLLRNRQGDESIREIRIKTLEVTGDGDKHLTIFDTPADLKGTSFLSYSHSITPDDQWLYVPALKRVKRINSANKSGPFMGSQFAYEDLASFEVDKYTYKYIKDDTLNNIETFVVENYPQYEYSGYTRQLVWVDKALYIPLKVEYYDRKNELLKTLVLSKYKQYLSKYWRAHKQSMENHQNGKTTVLTFSNYEFKKGLSDTYFTRNSLKRSR